MNAPTSLSVFNFAPGLAVHVIDREGTPWFVAQDVLYALGYPQTSHGKALSKLDPDERSMSQVHKGVRSMTIVNESGLYSLLFDSKKPEAQAFRKWVTSVVLPAIRKDGGYVMGEEKVVSSEMSGGSRINRTHQERRACPRFLHWSGGSFLESPT